MKWSIRNLAAIGLATLSFYTFNPAIAEATAKYPEVVKEYQTIKQYYSLEEKIAEVTEEIKKKKIPVSYFEVYGKELTLEDYSRIRQIAKKHNLRGNDYKKLIRIERTLEYEDFMDKVSDYYNIGKQDMILIWNQESCFDIKGTGYHGERGLSQFKEKVAKSLFGRLTKPQDRIYFDWERFYPEFNTKKYKFQQLSEDYKLNIIMAAAQIKLTTNIFKIYLKKANLNLSQLSGIVRNKGIKTTFKRLRTIQKNLDKFRLDEDLKKTIKNYRITKKRIKNINKTYRENEILLKTALEYIVHNGGGGAVKNITKDYFIGELLIYHLAIYMKKINGLYDLINSHYGSLENLTKAYQSTIEKIRAGQTYDLWGNKIKKINLQELRNYSTYGLITEINPEFFEKKQLTLINNYEINKDMSLELLDENIAKLLTAENIGQTYDKLVLFNQLEKAQMDLNKAWYAKDKKRTRIKGTKVSKLEREINKRFNIRRKHTGIKGIQADIIKLEEKIKNSGFEPDLEKYSKMTE